MHSFNHPKTKVRRDLFKGREKNRGITEDLLTQIGDTPMVRLRKLAPGPAELIAKVEYFNPGGSSKDRIGIALIEEAEKQGLLAKGGLIIEPTSGNTGIGLALAALLKGYRLILTMPNTMSLERVKLLNAYNVTLVLTDGTLGMKGAIDRAHELQAENPGSFIPQQFENPANPQAHYQTTAQEIWRDMEGKIDFFVSAVGTGGTITGTARGLKEKDPSIKIIAVEPAESPVLSGGTPGPHKIQGIGASFIPSILDRSLLDEVIPVSSENAFKTAKTAAQKEGLFIGISSGAALYAALEVADRSDSAEKRIVVLLPDSGERYLSDPLFGA